MAQNFNQQAQMIWNIADILRGGWRQHEYQDVILPLVVLKRLDSMLADTKEKVRTQYDRYHGKVKDLEPILTRASGVDFYNTSPYDFEKLKEEPRQIVKNFKQYLIGYSENIQEIFEKFDFDKQLARLEGGNLLYYIIEQLNSVDLRPGSVDNHHMGLLFEHLLYKFSEMSNEAAGEHYTPRDVIKVMAEVLFSPDQKTLKKPHIITRMYDPACGTGGMLTIGKGYVREHINPKAEIYLYGQELNSVSYAMAKSDMLITGENPDFIRGGEKDHQKASTLSNDQFFGDVFDYGLCNPPYGIDWKKDKDVVEREAARGFAGRFGAGLPRISDGQLLFLQHLVSKMKSEKDGGSRIGIVHNGSPLFTGDAGSGESEIRRWLLEKDYLEAIIALPDQLFYNTGINTYLWFVTNRKTKERKGKVQLIDARTFSKKMRKSLGNKRNEIDETSRARALELYEKFEESEYSKIFNATDFAYRQIVVERPLRLAFDMTDEKIDQAIKALGVDVSKAANRLKDTEKMKKQTQGSVLARGVERSADKAAGQLEIQLNIAVAIKSLKGKKWNDRAKFLTDVSEALALELGVNPARKVLKTIVDTVGARDEKAEICRDEDGDPEPDSELRDYENVPWGTDVNEYFKKEVLPFVPDAWINTAVRDHKDSEVGKVGYEIPFTRFFYTYTPPRELGAIEGDIEKIENELAELLRKL